MMKTEIQNVALVYLPQGQQDELRELYGLVETAMGKVTLTVSQNRTTPDPKTLIGSGKTEELRLAIENCAEKPQTVLFSRPLDAIQRRNLQEALGLTVIDNIDLILDIFALRATTAEGKKQVELAQLTYKLATRSDKDFSRQGAGIGTRGPGETQLETDKRIAREKIYRLRRELKEIAAQRDTTRKKTPRQPGVYRSACRLYQCGKVHPFQRPYRRRRVQRRQAFCHFGHHRQKI